MYPLVYPLVFHFRFLPILCLLPVPFLAVKGQAQIVDRRGHTTGEMPKIEHKAPLSTLRGFLVQLAKYMVPSKGAGTRLWRKKNWKRIIYKPKFLQHFRGLKVCTK